MSAVSTTLDPAVPARLLRRTVCRLQRLSAVLAIVAILEAIAVLLVSVTADSRFPIPLDFATGGFLGGVILFPLVGALIVQSRPLTRVAWLMVASGLGLGFGLLAFGHGATGMPPGLVRTPGPQSPL